MEDTAVTISLEMVESLLAQNNALLAQIYTAQLFCIGVIGAVFVLFVLYKFLRKCY